MENEVHLFLTRLISRAKKNGRFEHHSISRVIRFSGGRVGSVQNPGSNLPWQKSNICTFNVVKNGGYLG